MASLMPKELLMTLEIRSLMIDAARLHERDDYYRKLIRFAAQWDMNAIVFRVTDDQGSAMRFDCLPGARRKFQYTKKAMRELALYASRQGINLIPEVECLGHSRYITDLPEFKHLKEGHEDCYSGLCISNPGTYKILASIIRETAEVFEGELIHLGCDESVFGVCPKCKKKLAKESKYVLYARHIQRLHKIASSFNKRIIIWGDHITDLWGDGRIYDKNALKLIPKDVIIANWDYRHTVTNISTDELTRGGYKVLTCPALHWCRASVFPSKLEITNTKRFITQAHRYNDMGAIGSIITVWCPYRFIPDAMWHSYALAGRLMSERRPNRNQFEADFAKEFYGISAHRTLAKAYEHFYNSGIGMQKEIGALFFANEQGMQACAKISKSRIRYLEKNAGEAKKLFKRVLPKVRKHAPELRACILGTEIILEGCARSYAARELLSGNDRSRHAKLSRRARSLSRRIAKYWDRARYANDPYKFAPQKRESLHAFLLGQITEAAKFSKGKAK